MKVVCGVAVCGLVSVASFVFGAAFYRLGLQEGQEAYKCMSSDCNDND